MASQIQMVMYEGYLAEDPEMRFTPTGRPVTNFRIGSNHQYKAADGKVVKETTWLKVATWGKLAEIINQYCGKGSHVIVTGKLRGGKNGSPEVYALKSGEFGASFEITASEVRIIKGKEGAAVDGADTSDSTEDLPY